MSRWFRFYNEALDDPKVQQLDPVVFKHWINILCLACRHGGKLPGHEAMAFSLRLDIIGLESLLDRLLIAGLIDVRKGGANGSYIAPHGWEKRQYKSDTSTERVKRFRNATVTPVETAPETDTESDTERVEPNGSCASGDAPLTVSELVEDWNSLAGQLGLAKVAKLTDSRKRRAAARLRQYPEIEAWQKAFATIRGTPFLLGDNKTGWRADFDFLLQDKSFTKLVEGSYGQA